MPRRNRPIRNPVAQSPLLRKGGPHVKSKTGQRVQARLSTNSPIDEWLEEDELNQEHENGEQLLPDLFLFHEKSNEITLLTVIEFGQERTFKKRNPSPIILLPLYTPFHVVVIKKPRSRTIFLRFRNYASLKTIQQRNHFIITLIKLIRIQEL